MEDLLALSTRRDVLFHQAHAILARITKLVDPASPGESTLGTDERYLAVLDELNGRVTYMKSSFVSSALKCLVAQYKLLPQLLESERFVNVLGESPREGRKEGG